MSIICGFQAYLLFSPFVLMLFMVLLYANVATKQMEEIGHVIALLKLLFK